MDDGSSQKPSTDSSSSSASSISLPLDPPPVRDEVNSLAFDDMDDEEDEGEAAAAAMAEDGSGVESRESTYFLCVVHSEARQVRLIGRSSLDLFLLLLDSGSTPIAFATCKCL